METKFKVWDKDKKKMFMPEEIARLHFNKGKCYGILTWDEKMIFHFDLLPFIGILDGDKKEIYRGDLVQDIDMFDGVPHRGWIQEVFWNNKNAAFNLRPAVPYDSTLLQFNERRKILGNIYENPELKIGTTDVKKKKRRGK